MMNKYVAKKQRKQAQGLLVFSHDNKLFRKRKVINFMKSHEELVLFPLVRSLFAFVITYDI